MASPVHMFRSAFDKAATFVPRSRYTTSMEGLTFRQAIHMPLPPYLSPLPVIFRMLAYAVITPFVLLLVLDIGGYFVWRIYEQPIWSNSIRGTRTAFYKFRASPVFVRSRNGSPTISKNEPTLAASPPYSPDTRENSLSPISSSASLQDETISDAELLSNFTSPSSSFISPPQLDTSNLDSTVRRRTVHQRSDNSSSKHFSLGTDDDVPERSQTPTLTSLATERGAPHLARSNSLGLGFSTTNGHSTASTSDTPMYIRPSGSNTDKVASNMTANQSADDLVQISASPAGSAGSSNTLEEDDRFFREAMAIPVKYSPSTASQ